MESLKVIFEDHHVNPKCPHGPTLLLQKFTSKGTKQYYACSAYRSRKFCDFYYQADKDLTSISQYLEDKEALERPPRSHEEYMKRLDRFLMYPKANRSFCCTCSELLLIEERCDHMRKQHVVMDNVDLDVQLPTSLLVPLTDNKAFAQFHFSDETVNFLIKQLAILGFSRVACIGCPRIHEKILSECLLGLETLLLDIDYRHMQFNTRRQFCRYNLFNHWFFGDSQAEKVFENFLCKNDGEGVVIILDPPFGGLIDAISNTLRKICHLWKKTHTRDDKEVPFLWCFPYFNEKRIIKNHKSIQMLDYQVQYENQKHYKRGTCGSPVRIFTNLKPSSFVLLQEHGFRFCSTCQKYISKGNQHCVLCNSCTSKNGATYTHCNECGICVKSTYRHCPGCESCHLPSHKCEANSSKTVISGFHRHVKCRKEILKINSQRSRNTKCHKGKFKISSRKTRKMGSKSVRRAGSLVS